MTLQDDELLARLITLDAPLGWFTRNDIAEVLRDADARIAEADRRVETLTRRLSFATRLLLPWRSEPPITPERCPDGLASRKAGTLADRGYLPLRRNHPRAYPELRIAHLGVSARFASLAPHTPLTEQTYETVLDRSDLVIIEPSDDDPNLLATFAPILLNAAAHRGIPTVVIFTRAPTVSVWHDAAYVVSELDGAEAIGLSVDTETFNPVGYQLVTNDPVVAVNHTGAHAGELDGLEFTPRIVTYRGQATPAHDPLTTRTIGTPAGLRNALRHASVLADMPGLRHRDPAVATRLILAALATGIPVVTTDDTHAAIAPHGVIVTDTLPDTIHTLVDDLDRREQLSITARRHVLTHHSRAAAFTRLLNLIGYPVAKPPHVTVLLATNRPTFLTGALAGINRQTHRYVDVSLVMHGDAFDRHDLPDDPQVTAVTRAPADWTLGSCLNAALDEARGTFVAKMDDDDHYGPNHLTDLLLAHDYAQADIVGKQAEFVYLAAKNVTVRRGLGPAERRRAHVAGPTPLMRRELAAQHRFLPIPRRVDSTLYERVIAQGGSVYATHARDFILERHSAGHTWTIDDDTFLTEATETYDGLAETVASSDPQ